jgi:hypothetical protein
LRWFKAKSQVAQAAACGHKARMKSLTEQIWFETPHRRDYLNITGKVESVVRKATPKLP